MYLKWVKEVEEAPHDDGVVVDGDVEGCDGAGESNPAQQRVDLVPDDHRALLEPLADGELQVQDGHALHEQHDQVGDQERAW